MKEKPNTTKTFNRQGLFLMWRSFECRSALRSVYFAVPI